MGKRSAANLNKIIRSLQKIRAKHSIITLWFSNEILQEELHWSLRSHGLRYVRK